MQTRDNPDKPAEGLMLVYILVGILLIVLGTPLVLGMIPPNSWYGIRLPGYATPDKWYRLNHRGGLVLVLLGILFTAAGVAMNWITMADQTRILLAVLIFPAIVMAAILGVFLGSRSGE
jgi:hypothetical protein